MRPQQHCACIPSVCANARVDQGSLDRSIDLGTVARDIGTRAWYVVEWHRGTRMATRRDRHRHDSRHFRRDDSGPDGPAINFTTMRRARASRHLNILFTRTTKTAREGSGELSHRLLTRAGSRVRSAPLHAIEDDAGMTSGVPWQSKEVKRRTRRAAREAARHCGISVGDWLDHIILEAASKQGIDPERLKQSRYGTYEDTADENLPPRCCFDAIVGPLRDDLTGIRDALRGSVPSETFLVIVRALQQLSRKVAHLVEKIATSDARLKHLEAIERELAEALVHIVRQHAANRAPLARMPAPDLDALSRDIAELRESEKKVQGSLELIHGGLAHVIDRLDLIEINMRKDVASAPDALPSV